MSHITRGRINVAYKDKELLLRALNGLGTVVENERLYRVGPGLTSERYPLVLMDSKNNKYRIGYQESNGVWQQFQEDYGSYGEWTKRTSELVEGRYLAFHYERQLVDEGFEVEMEYLKDGTIDLVANEVGW